ncbi:hypothetical protein AB1Y20_001678 [Prymnesium parvum]|uniref:WSC domain-containing protein n=1 Tax=Prymnesium parvum TaxID=97485 RepID=A0AB34KBJ9_PRYPA
MRPQHRLLLVLSLGILSHLLIHAFSPQLGAAGRRAVRLVVSHRSPTAAPPAPPAVDASPPLASASASSEVEHALPPLQGCSSDPADDGRPGLSVLVVHEHHLKAIGSDLRLLGVLMQLRSLGHTASFLARGKVPPAQRSPPTEQLLRLMGSRQTAEAPLTAAELPPPPAVYEYVDLASLSAFARRAWFDAILCTFWFWRDPMPSSAELLLPSLALHAPPSRRPFIGVLSDDAHSAKAAMMAEWEVDHERKAMWEQRARTLPARQRAVYALSDAVVHISESDSTLERALFNLSCAQWLTLRMSPRGFHSLDLAPPPAASTSPPAAAAATPPLVGFMGNGATPTNHLAVQWFLDAVWPAARRALPGIRLRLVGYPPDDRPRRQQGGACSPRSATRCGWAWGTAFAAREAASGIDELGFLSDERMIAELRSWRAMVVPILRSTGVNTKLFPALQLGVPIVLTSVAASPLRLPLDDSVALVADTADRFAAQIARVVSTAAEAARLAAASRAHWRQMNADDASAAELRQLLRLVCPALRTPADDRPLPTPPAPSDADARADVSGARKAPLSRCFGGGGRAKGGPAAAALVVMHGSSAHEAAALLTHAVWAAVCKHCELRCVHSRSLLRRKDSRASKWDVLIDHESTASPLALAAALAAPPHGRALRLIHMPSQQFAAALVYAERGAALASLAHSERLRAQLPAALAAAGVADGVWTTVPLEPLANDTQARAEFGASWRRVAATLGVAHAELEGVVGVATKVRHGWTKERATPRWVGCYRDRSGGRAMSSGPRSFGHTTQSCAAACTGYHYFALQSGGQCFCSRTVPKSSNHSKVADAKCGSVCVAEEGKQPPRLCGGSSRAAVYSNPCSRN